MRLDILAAISGFMIAFQARANGELSHRLGNGFEAALVSFSSGLIIIILIALFHPGIKDGIRKVLTSVNKGELARWKLLAGALGGTFVALQTQIVPLVGVAIYSVASIAGQTAMSLGVDRVGLTGGGPKPISRRRVGAALITVLAIYVSVFDRLDSHNLPILAVVGAAIAGAVVGVQRALNGQINEHSGQSFATSFFNFLTGSSLLFLVLIFVTVTKRHELVALPAGPWWIYTGGVIGVIYIAFSATIVQHVGVLTFTLFSVGGQLLSSFLIDLFSPTHGVHVSAYLATGIVMTYLGVIVGGVNNSQHRKAPKQQ